MNNRIDFLVAIFSNEKEVLWWHEDNKMQKWHKMFWSQHHKSISLVVRFTHREHGRIFII